MAWHPTLPEQGAAICPELAVPLDALRFFGAGSIHVHSATLLTFAELGEASCTELAGPLVALRDLGAGSIPLHPALLVLVPAFRPYNAAFGCAARGRVSGRSPERERSDRRQPQRSLGEGPARSARQPDVMPCGQSRLVQEASTGAGDTSSAPTSVSRTGPFPLHVPRALAFRQAAQNEVADKVLDEYPGRHWQAGRACAELAGRLVRTGAVADAATSHGRPRT